MFGVTTGAVKLEHVIARNMAGLRVERDWTQSDLAWRMTAMGVTWTPNRVAQLETLRRPVSLLEVTALAWVFEVPLTRFAEGNDLVELPNGADVPLEQVRAAWAGDASVQVEARNAIEVSRSRKEEIRKIAKGLDLPSGMLDWVARRMFGHGLIEERDLRLGDLTDLPKRSAQTKRGHATRAIVGEVEKYLDDHGRTIVTQEYREHVGGVIARRA